MEQDTSFSEVTRDIKDGRYDSAKQRIDSMIPSGCTDAGLLIKCASVLKTIDDESGCDRLLDRVASLDPATDDERFEISLSLRGLGRADDAYEMMRGMSDYSARGIEAARTLHTAGEDEEALSLLEGDASVGGRLLRCDVLCSLGEFSKALAEAQSLAEDESNSYESLVNLCTVMILMGREKDAVKLARSFVKDDKKSPDALALGAYVMRINGKLPAAANLANRALHIDPLHIGALETMAMCLLEKGRRVEAKVLAGAINDKCPGHPAALRILAACSSSER